METEEITKLVDGIYKNILDKFNPGARQLINAGKAYLKALHGAAAASRLYVEAISKLARQAQQGTWGGSQDIGTALSQIVQVYKEIQSQQMNILKAFYVDLLVPLETNLEKDTKVVQSEQKRFLQQHKQRSETYSKAVASMKKQRKKNKGATKTGLAMDKELKHMQVLEEEKSKLDAFCEQSLKTAMTQERRRYGFVLERQCSLAKHYMAYHTQGATLLQRYMDEWQEVAGTREYLPEQVDAVFASRLRQVSFWPDDEQVYSSPRSPLLLMSPDDSESADRLSVTSQLRKTKSMDASCLDVRSINDMTAPGPSTPKPLSRARSEFNLAASSHSLAHDIEPPDTPVRPKSMAVPERAASWDTQLARALYAYLSSGENQLSFLEGDVIALMGDRNKGWQFGENLRTQCSGWFPLAYTEMILDDSIVSSPTHLGLDSSSSSCVATPSASGALSGKTVAVPGIAAPTPETRPSPPNAGTPTNAGSNMNNTNTISRPGHLDNASRQLRQRMIISSNGVPPPSLPAPPKPHSVGPNASTLPPRRLHGTGTNSVPPAPPAVTKGRPTSGPPATGSLHSSNDSGFSNDPPPAPEVDYSDDESSRQFKSSRLEKRNQQLTKKNLMSSVRGWLLYKSALDLWDDVNSQQPSTLNKQQHQQQQQQQKTQSSSTTSKHNRLRHATSTNHLLTNQPLSLPPTTSFDDTTSVASVKRTKSLWRFRRSQKDEDVILEGMSLWQHRSLVDIRKNELETIKRAINSTPQQQQQHQLPPPPPPPSVPAPQPPQIPLQIATVKKQPKLHQIYNIDDDGLAEPELDDDVDDDDDDIESCIVVDDHTADMAPIPRPKCHTLTPKRERRAITVLAATLQHNHFDSKRNQSPTNDGICGPWYDLWGIDASVVN